jgi:hypothetical protein
MYLHGDFVTNSRKRKWQIATLAGCVAAFFALYAYRQSISLCMAEAAAIRDNPALSMIPQLLVGPDREASPGTIVTEGGYQFEAPWKDVASENLTEHGGVVHFANGISVAALPLSGKAGPAPGLLAAAARRRGLIDCVFGGPEVVSLYESQRRIFEVTPRDLSLFSLPSTLQA